MKRQSWINLALLGIIGLLGLALWLTPEQQPQQDQARLTPLQPDAITRIRIDHKSGPPTILLRQGEVWRMATPYQAVADGGRIQRLLAIANTPSLEHFPRPAEGLNRFGLAQPRIRLRLDGVMLQIGDRHPFQDARYVAIDDRIHLIRNRFMPYLQSPAETFIDPRLLPAGSRIEGIRTPRWRLQESGDGRWQLQPPLPGLSMDQLMAKRDQWQNARAMAVHKAPGEESGEEVRIQLQGRPQAIRFGILQRDGKSWLIRRDLGLAYQLPAGSDLLAPPGNAKPTP